MFRIGKQLSNGEEKEKRIQDLNALGMKWGKTQNQKSTPAPSGENFGQ